MSITVADFKAHDNIVSDEDDDVIQSKIDVACALVENFVGEKLIDFDPVPAPILEAIRQLTTHLYENREPFVVGVQASALPYNAIDLLMPYRRVVC